MLKILLLFIALLLTVPIASRAEYKMGEAAPVKVSEGDSEPAVTKESGATISRSTSRKAKGVAFPHKDGPAANPEDDVIDALSKRYNVPAERLRYYRALHFGYEELVPALVVAREAQAEVGRVLKQRMEGQPWTDVAKSLFVDLTPLNKEVGEILKPIRARLPKRALEEKPENQLSKPVAKPKQEAK